MSGLSALRALVETRLAALGLALRGEVAFAEGDEAPRLADGRTAGIVLLVGVSGDAMWPKFSAWRKAQGDGGGADPLDNWSKITLTAIAAEIGATPYFPPDPPYQPFQQWAMRAEGLRPSPLGILIHPVYGLWHSYRGALGLPEAETRDTMMPVRHACLDCRDKPCLSACPVNAVILASFDVTACRQHLATVEGEAGCRQYGCLARDACPVGKDHRYPSEQVRFHMQALTRPQG